MMGPSHRACLDWSGTFDIPMKTKEYGLSYDEQVCEKV